MGVSINTNTSHETQRNLFGALKKSMQNCAMSAAGCAVSGAAEADVKFANTVTYAIGGVIKTKSTATVDMSAQTTPALDDQAADTQCNYLICINAAGTAYVVQGTPSADADTAAEWPATPAGSVCVGGFVVKNEMTYKYVPGTTAWNATNLTETFYDFTASPADILE